MLKYKTKACTLIACLSESLTIFCHLSLLSFFRGVTLRLQVRKIVCSGFLGSKIYLADKIKTALELNSCAEIGQSGNNRLLV